MVTINLLPWRTFEREFEAKALRKILIICASFMIVFLLAIHFYLQMKERQIQFIIHQLKKDLKPYYHQKRKFASLESSTRQLKQQKFMKDLFIKLGELNQDAICFTDIETHHHKILFKGKAHSAEEFSEFMSHWNVVKLFSEIQIQTLEQKNGSTRFLFQARES